MAQTAKPYEVYVADTSGQGLPDGRSFGHLVTCTNLDKYSSSQISADYYRYDGLLWFSNNYTIQPNSKTDLGGNYIWANNGAATPVSIIVRSERTIACNVKSWIGGNGYQSWAMSAAAYPGTYSQNGSLVGPQIMKRLSGTWNTRMVVQNINASPVTIITNYIDRLGQSYPNASETVTIPGRASYAFNTVNNNGLPDGFLGGVTVSAIGTLSILAGFVEMYNSGATYQSAQLQGYNLVNLTNAGISTQLPVFRRNYYGFSSGFSAYNAGIANQTIRATYTFNGVNYVQDSPAIPPGGVWAVYAPNVSQINPVDSLAESQRSGSVVLASLNNQKIIAIVNEDNRGTCNVAVCGTIPESWKGSGSTYNTNQVTTAPSNAGSADSYVVFSDVPRDDAGWQGGFQLRNLGSGTVSCSIEYAGQTSENVSISANSTLSRFLPTQVPGLNNSFNGLIRIKCSPSSYTVIGIANVNNRTSAFRGDGFYSFNPIPSAPYYP